MPKLSWENRCEIEDKKNARIARKYDERKMSSALLYKSFQEDMCLSLRKLHESEIEKERSVVSTS